MGGVGTLAPTQIKASTIFPQPFFRRATSYYTSATMSINAMRPSCIDHVIYLACGNSKGYSHSCVETITNLNKKKNVNK